MLLDVFLTLIAAVTAARPHFRNGVIQQETRFRSQGSLQNPPKTLILVSEDFSLSAVSDMMAGSEFGAAANKNSYVVQTLKTEENGESTKTSKKKCHKITNQLPDKFVPTRLVIFAHGWTINSKGKFLAITGGRDAPQKAEDVKGVIRAEDIETFVKTIDPNNGILSILLATCEAGKGKSDSLGSKVAQLTARPVFAPVNTLAGLGTPGIIKSWHTALTPSDVDAKTSLNWNGPAKNNKYKRFTKDKDPDGVPLGWVPTVPKKK